MYVVKKFVVVQKKEMGKEEKLELFIVALVLFTIMILMKMLSNIYLNFSLLGTHENTIT